MTTALPDKMESLDGPITAQDMVDRGKLLPLAEARRVLATTEPLATVRIDPSPSVWFRAEEGWNLGLDILHGTAAIPVWLRVGSGVGEAEYQMSKDGLLTAAKLAGVSSSYLLKCPAELLQHNLNYWYGGGMDKEVNLLTVGPNSIGQALTRESLQSFSNLEILDQIVGVMTRRYRESDLYVDVSKLAHSLRKTYFQIVIPAESHVIRGSGVNTDAWWAGLQFRNSQVGELQTSISGYFFRPLCTNGMIDSGPTMGTWSRRSGSEEDEVYAWAAQAVDEVLGGFEATLATVRESAEHSLEGGVIDVVRDVFDNYSIPHRAQSRVIDALVEDRELTVYSVLNALTQAANDASGPDEAQRLMMTGGDLARHHSRCDSCQRLLV